MSSTGISIKKGITNFDLSPYIHKNIIIDNSEECFFLIDSSKFGNDSLRKIIALEKVKNIITDKDIDKKTASEFKKIIPNFYIVDY